MKTQFNYKKATLLAVCLSVLLAAGCSSEVDGWEIDKAINTCAERGGIDKMPVTFGSRVICRDATLHEIQLGG